jgi:hypothetical protein
MSDSTAFIDATADSTTIIIIDSTTSDVENFTATVATGLVSDFNGFMGPLGAKCDQLGGQFDSIKDQISGIGNNYTPGGAFDSGVANGLNGAYNSSRWAQGKDALDMAKNVLDKCSFFKEMAPAFPKYGDPFKQIKSLAKSAGDKAEAAADAAIDKIKNSSGYQFLEASIGKSIAAISNTGQAVFDKVEGAVEDVESAISPVIEYGKSAISKTQTALSSATKELAKMDKLIDCLTAVGGPDFSPQLDEMMDQMNCYYDKLGVFDDPLLPNFGEFNVDQYLSTIGSLDPQAATNIKKSINMYSKARNNALGSILKVSDIAKKADSVTDVTATAEPIAQKTEAIATNTKGTQTIPGIPGKTETKTVDLPAPVPVGEPPLPDPPNTVEPKIPYTTWVKESKVLLGEGVKASAYEKYDPGYAQFPIYLAAAYGAIVDMEYEEPDEIPNIKMEAWIDKISFGYDPGKDWLGRDEYLLAVKCIVRIVLTNTNTGKTSVRNGPTNMTLRNRTWTRNRDDLDDIQYRIPLLNRSLKSYFKLIYFGSADPTVTG